MGTAQMLMLDEIARVQLKQPSKVIDWRKETNSKPIKHIGDLFITNAMGHEHSHVYASV